MSNTIPLPNDSADNEAVELAVDEELAAIKEKITRREDSIDGLRAEILAEAKSRINGLI